MWSDRALSIAALSLWNSDKHFLKLLLMLNFSFLRSLCIVLMFLVCVFEYLEKHFYIKCTISNKKSDILRHYR